MNGLLGAARPPPGLTADRGVQDRVLALTDHLCAELPGAGCEVLSPRRPATRSGIVVFRHAAVPNEELHARLLEAGVRCSVRGGGIRFSPHQYNTVEEVEGALDVIRSAPG